MGLRYIGMVSVVIFSLGIGGCASCSSCMDDCGPLHGGACAGHCIDSDVFRQGSILSDAGESTDALTPVVETEIEIEADIETDDTASADESVLRDLES